MNSKKCCVVFVTHKSSLEGYELKSFQQCLDVFSPKRDIKLVIPNNISTEFYDKYSDKFEYCKVNHEWLSSYKAYNKTCCTKEFYELFKNYDYILKYESDAWVFEDRLDEFIGLGYDYYGAPWPQYEYTVGNSGLTLRRIRKIIEIVEKYSNNQCVNEDWWFCQEHGDEMKICEWKIAVNFSLETISDRLLNSINGIPMGFHGKHLINLWDKTGRKFIKYIKKPRMKISVITINLNNKNWLERTITSVINQTLFNDIEYIVIDGGSTDGSLDIIEKYKDKIDYYVSEKDNGIYNAMNKGINAASGKYAIFLNSGDEFYDKTSIEKCYWQLDKDIVYGNLLVMDEEQKYIKQPFIKKYPNVITSKYMAVDSVPHNGSFIKLKLLKKEKYNENFKIISDWAFFYKKILMDCCTYKHIDVTVSKFYLGGASSDEKQIQIEKTYFHNNLRKYDHEISVIIPCYNQGKYIKETIDSLKKSIYEDFHCIIVNDGSTDNSEKVILKEIDGDNRFEYFSNENHGLSYTRNFGINKTNSKYILCLDSDDKISSAYIECAVRYLNSHPDTSVFYGNAIMFYDNGNMTFWKLPKFSYSSLLDVNSIYCSCVYRRKDYERVGGYDESMKSGYEDWEFLIRLLYNNDNVYRTDDIVFYYRRHNDSMDASTRKNAKEIKEYIKNKNKKLFNIIEKQNIPITLIKCNDKDNFYGNLSDLKNIDENILKDEKYVAVYQNGKRFNFPNEAPTVDEIFSKYDSVVAKPLVLKTTIREQYATNHNIEDFNIIEKIIADKYPSYVNAWHNFINGNIFVPHNIFIMKKEDFKKYIEFIFGVLDEYLKIVGTDINKRIEDNKDKYLKDFYPNNTIEYQYRIGGYIGERLTNVFLINNFKLMKTYPVIVTEDKYKNE